MMPPKKQLLVKLHIHNPMLKDNVPVQVVYYVYSRLKAKELPVMKKTSVHKYLGADDTYRTIRNHCPNFVYFIWKGQTIRNSKYIKINRP